MTNYKIFYVGLLLISPFFLFAQQRESNLNFVDPTIGSVGVILQPTRPTVHLPNSMVRVFPMRKDQLDDQISNFQLMQTSHRLSPVFAFLPVSGLVENGIWSKKLENEQEKTTPHYYATSFIESGDQIEFTPQARSGYFRIQFSGKENHFLRLGLFSGVGEINVSGKRIVTGTEEFTGMKAFFYAEVDNDISEVRRNSSSRQLLICFGNQPKKIAFKYGVSYVSIDQARQNLQKEIPDWDFEAVKTNAQRIWEKALSQINVSGGTFAQKRVFYTSLYRCYERMVDINEYGKYFSAFDRQIHESKEPFFVDNWMWDTYIALEPLHMILNPDMEVQKINSYIQMYKQGGTIPSFAVIFGDWPAMTGNFAAAWMADAWFKGLKKFDLETAYEGLKKNSLDRTLLPWNNGPKTELDDFYSTNGYMPGLAKGQKETVSIVDTAWEKRQSVSVTTANSYSDWCLSRLASELNNKEDEKLFLKRAENYKNVYRSDKGFMWPKDKNGSWIEQFDPRFAGREYFTENNAYTYNWDVKHDLHGLFDLMGGRQKAEQKLDQLFREDLGLPKWKFWNTQPDASGLVGQFVMGNEPSFHIPYIYNYLGAPWKTQKRIRSLLNTFFTDNLFGLPGDEDGGGMSAFVVFSMMGFFPVTQGIPIYNIGSPVFENCTIQLPNGKKFTVLAKGSSNTNKYIQKAFWNAHPLIKPWFSHEEMLKGGTLELIMGNLPNLEWGAGSDCTPPSDLNYHPSSSK